MVPKMVVLAMPGMTPGGDILRRLCLLQPPDFATVQLYSDLQKKNFQNLTKLFWGRSDPEQTLYIDVLGI